MWRVLGAFMNNRGILLAGGVGYNILLSTIPLLALTMVLLAGIVDEQQLFKVITFQLNHLTSAHAEVVLQAVHALIDSRHAIGTLGIPVLVVFSSFAFHNLEGALAIIFRSSDNELKRSAWKSALLPYAFIAVLGIGLMILALTVSLFTHINQVWAAFHGQDLLLASLSGFMLNLASFIGVFLLFSAIYKIMPVEKIALRRALVGGFMATLLWEGVRLLLVFYFAHLSYVNTVYSSLATMIVLLFSLKVGTAILLLGAQAIAELERNVRLGVPWYQDTRNNSNSKTNQRQARQRNAH
ncbi:YihY/virulence factor BrkB family protein [Halomonas halocynthiae]|uniref:YihY/virulence factor BrkB family protein n=1 Tax=Halomonas halocynthiae TaxID=176290 RepID=UPI000A033308|nr:YihY/virulence factor BrkB family protein [Halomonas halocynthiae]